jgi:hypothetical protein
VKEDLINQLSSRVGLPADQAGRVVDTVLDYFKQNPNDLTEMMGGGGSWKDKIPGL